MAEFRQAPVSSVYVHVPFCSRQCGYCDFAIAVGSQPDGAAWLAAIRAEWSQRLQDDQLHVAPQLQTLYVGGGTPSLLGAEVMAGLRDLFGAAALAHSELEWTGEANPESLDAGVLDAWRSAGVTRVSLGIQSFHEPTLRWMGRLHGPEGGEEALRCVLRAGLKSATADLIFGVPVELERPWRTDLERLAGSGVPHISLYGLTVEAGTPLARAVAEGRTEPVDGAQYEEEYLEAAERLVAEGYEHYEVSSFARPGHRSLHNQGYWRGIPYLGLGNGAHSFLPPLRSWNVRAWRDYQDRVVSGASPLEDCETIDGEKAHLEALWLGLRRREGLPMTVLDGQRVAQWCRGGLAEVREERVALTAAGWLLLDQLVVDASGDATPKRVSPAPELAQPG